MSLKYRAAKDNVTGHLALFAREQDGLPFQGAPEFPVAILTAQSAAFPLAAQQVAENMADLLNHRAPAHKLSSGTEKIFYSRTDDGIILRTQNAGVSAPALTVTVSNKSSVADLGQSMLAKMDQDFMKRVCDTIVPGDVPTLSAQQKGPAGPGVRP